MAPPSPSPSPSPSGPPAVRAGEDLDPLVLSFSEDAPFERLRSDTRRLLDADPDRYRDVHAHLALGERPLDLFDLRRLVHLLKDEYEVHVVGLRCSRRNLHRFAEKELKLRIHLDDPAPAAERVTSAGGASLSPTEAPDPPSPLSDAPTEETAADGAASPGSQAPPSGDSKEAGEPSESGERVHIVRRTLRSGSAVHFGGDVLVFGDVNPGAQVVAGGSILVMGALKGLAHAGARGREDAFVLSFDLRPTQIRIASRIAIPPDSSPDRGSRPISPEIAHVRDDRILIEPYRGRLPRTCL